MRSINSFKNITISIAAQLIIALLGFVSRKVFLDSLGAEYLGVNGLLENVLSILALVESGIGTSIIYHLYKPLAEKNLPKIIALVRLYKKAYAVIAIVVLILSLTLYPFLGNIMKNSAEIRYLEFIYFLFIAKNMMYYLNAHKVSLINADQKGYILARINFVFQAVMTIAKIIVLLMTKNYVFYLILELCLFLIQNIVNGRIVLKHYSFLNTKSNFTIDKLEKKSLTQNIKASFFHNLGGYIVFGTDNILISSFIGLSTVGLYSNYLMIVGQLSALVTPILGGIGSSVGNLIAVESKEKSYEIFKVTYLVNFWIYSVCAIFLYNVLEPFISWWLGTGYLLDSLTFIVILLNFYITGLRASILMFKIKGGIFVQDKYVPLIEAAINLGASLILVRYIGLAGIFIGTTLSTLITVFWNAPRLVYRHIFNKPVRDYFYNYLIYLILTIIT
ncbi:oligosaccharide flippase family protein, partial [Neobacillus drentensis]|uniref:lipopolysaccharide biosynthesis protein n=1 Tax=Neobacillus drentensis TaxID=220684 RepID=UPI002FFFBBDF